MDRVLLGKATTNTTSSYYHRSGQQGLFISKPGANVHNCSDGDLMFDSTAAGLVQMLGNGRVSVPKQLYDKGIFGEVGTITEDNWDKPSESLDASPNRQTSWIFDMLDDVKDQTDTFTRTSWKPKDVSDPYGPIGPLYNYIFSKEDSMGFASYHWASFARVANKYFSFGKINSKSYGQTMCKNLWRIQNVFPFLANIPLVFNITPYMGGSVKNSRSDLLIPRYLGFYDNPPGSGNNINPNVTPTDPAVGVITEETVNIAKPLSLDTIDDLTDTQFYDFISPAYKAAWSDYVLQNNAKYPDSTYYAGEPMIANEPKIWRAWTRPFSDNPGAGNTPPDEQTLKHLFYQYQFLLSWAYYNFGLYVNDETNTYGPFDFSVFNGYYPETDAIQRNRPLFYLIQALQGTIPGFVASDPDWQVDAGSTPKVFTEYTSTGNWGYTDWKNGTIDVSTNIEAPSGDRPVQVWWNVVTRETGNTTTNLSFLNIRDHVAKTSTNSERLTSLKPGITSITGNTYVKDNMIHVKFEQPSTEDTADIYYTVFRENSFFDSTDSVDTLVFNVTDVNDPNFPGDNYAGRRQIEPTWTVFNQSASYSETTREDYGRYYGIVFPDDFVQTKGTATDPFRGYRNANGIIDYGLNIILNIPEGVEVSSNSHAKLITFDELHNTEPQYGNLFKGAAAYGPSDPAGRISRDRNSMVDPCIKLNLNSQNFTDRALQTTKIRIENNGILVGGGGYGQYGQMLLGTKNYQTATAGGGGGGGAGYHPPWLSESVSDWTGQISVSASDYIASISSTANTLPATDPSGTTDWVYHWAGRIDDKARYTDRSATSQVEKNAHRTAISTFWAGPNNYVEWGIGGQETPNNFMTGMNGITIDSLAPGKPGTGYLGMSPNQDPEEEAESRSDHPGPTGFPRWNQASGDAIDMTFTRPFLGAFSATSKLPYYETLLKSRDAFGRYEKDLYPRMVGTYQIYSSQWIPRFEPSFSKAGNSGEAGGKTTGGAGGLKGAGAGYGTDQDQYNSIAWGGLDALNGFGQGLPAAGNGGSIIYLFANTESSISGTSVELINNPTGFMKSGGGGGSAGGSSTDGLAGGDLGRPGKWYTGFSAQPGANAGTPESAGSSGFPTDSNDPSYGWRTHSVRGEPGKLVWWNTANVTSSYTIQNKAKGKNASIEGLDYNPGIKGWDYVSYLPDATVSIPRIRSFTGFGFPVTIFQGIEYVQWDTTGLKLWGRKLNEDGHLVYTRMNEYTFEAYLDTLDATVHP